MLAGLSYNWYDREWKSLISTNESADRKKKLKERKKYLFGKVGYLSTFLKKNKNCPSVKIGFLSFFLGSKKRKSGVGHPPGLVWL